MNTTGPAASEGPALVALNDTFPVVPGVIDGVVTAIETSAAAGATDASLVAPLLPGVGSAVGDGTAEERRQGHDAVVGTGFRDRHAYADARFHRI